METGNMSKNKTEEVYTNQDSYTMPASCRILQDLNDVYINPEDCISADLESGRFHIDSKSDTPDKYPNAPQTSPIDLQSMPDKNVFTAELLRCLRNLPMIRITSDERTKDGSQEIPGVYSEELTRSYAEASTFAVPKIKLRSYKDFEDCENTTEPNYLADDDKNRPAEACSTDVNNLKEKFHLLTVDSESEFAAEFYRRGTLSDRESMIVNYGSDVSDISWEDCEYESSDDDSSCRSRDRIEFEALAIDSTSNPAIIQRIQNCKIKGKNKRALSLDDMIPSKIFHTADFSKTEFEITF